MRSEKLWLSVEEAAPILGVKTDAIYRDIREKQFPFEFVRLGKRIRISARSIGLTPITEPRNSEAQTQGESLAATT